MKYQPGSPARVELTRRNLTTLLAKLDDPASARTLMKQQESFEGDEWVQVVAVEDDEHYANRAAGQVYMPSTQEVI